MLYIEREYFHPLSFSGHFDKLSDRWHNNGYTVVELVETTDDLRRGVIRTCCFDFEAESL